MTTQILEYGYTTDQTMTAQLFAIGSDTVVQTASAVTEATNRKGRYLATFTSVPAGRYLMVYSIGGVGAGSEVYTLTLTAATFQPESEIDIAAIKAKTDALPNSPASVSDIPTASQNATAVRSELTPELAEIPKIPRAASVIPAGQYRLEIEGGQAANVTPSEVP